MITIIRQTIIYLFMFFSLASFTEDSRIILDKKEAKKAFILLNNIRANPVEYSRVLRINKNLHTNKTPLVWNDDLAKVAQARAYDMAKRNYFNHIDPEGYGVNDHVKKSGYSLNPQWTRNKRDNFFESIEAGAIDGQDCIRLLIIDRGVPSLAHRKHLLGIGSWNASLVDIGIGFVRRGSGSNYRTYTSIVIAKHN